MIFDMDQWRRELLEIAESLRQYANEPRWTRSADAAVEKRVMLGFYAIRKMLPGHAFRPPPLLEEPPSVSVTAYPRNTSRLSSISWPEVSEAFDLTKPHRQDRDLEYICNQVIHSHFFTTWLSPDQVLQGVFCCSDKLKDREIYRLELNSMVDLFHAAGSSCHKVASFRHFGPEENRIVL